MAEDLDDGSLGIIVVNWLRETLKVGAVKAPGFGTDIEKVTLGDLGREASARADKDTTTIVGGAGSSAEITGRIAQFRALIDDTISD